MFRRLKSLGANCDELLDVYDKQIRCVLELAVAVWEPGLSQIESKQIERVQKSAFSIIMGDDYLSYACAIHRLERKKLSQRRYDLCIKFAKKSQLHPKYKNWFTFNPEMPEPIDTRSEKVELKFKPVKTRTDRYKNSPLPYLTKVLNESCLKKSK